MDNLEKLLSAINVTDIDVSDEDYEKWKQHYETLPEHEKVFTLLGAVSQAVIDPESCTARSIMAIAVICTNRWINEKELDVF